MLFHQFNSALTKTPEAVGTKGQRALYKQPQTNESD